MKEIEQLDIDFNDLIDTEEIVNIDMDEVGEESIKSANSVISNIIDLYSDEEFMSKNPKLKQRIETELESLRVLIKLRKADEITHDLIIKAISQKPSNASLYRSMTDIQRTILCVTTKIEDVIKGLSGILKNYQLELNFKEDAVDATEDESDESDNNGIYRGSKDFIKMITEKKEAL